MIQALAVDSEYSAATTDLTVTINKTLHAPIEAVFDAWLNSKMLSRFMIPMPGMVESRVENDAREGGGFTIIMHVGDDKLPHTGEYLEINRPDKLVFSWVSHCSVDQSTVTLDFVRLDENKTDLTLTHVNFLDEKTRSDHEGGWDNIIDTLSKVVS